VQDFVLVRDKDVTGRSGTGVVAEGVVFTDGFAILKWLREPYALGIYETVEALISVHGHEGNTHIEFIEKNTSISNP
jgi:hypothetical protein